MLELPNIPLTAWLVAAFFVFLAASVYGEQIRRIRRDGGKVRTGEMGFPELLMSIVFASFFGLMVLSAIRRHAADDGGKIAINVVLPSAFMFIAFALGIILFLHYGRRVKVSHVFGFDRVPALAAVGWICGLLLAAYPLVGMANFLTMLALQNQMTPQPLVKLFSEVARGGDHLSVAKILLTGVVIQPACEEFLFRGFFYTVWKRYLGGWGAGLLACVLFAAFHTSLPAFGGLLVLAVCLNIAYERTGSLLVPIGMHALFNFSSLLVLYVQARFGPPIT